MDSTEKDPVRLLFVCMGNICRSPAAENVMRAIAEREGLADRLEIDSAGTISMHTGNPPDDRMTEAANRRGIAMTGRARQVVAADLSTFDWVLVMDEETAVRQNRLALLQGIAALADGTADLAQLDGF